MSRLESKAELWKMWKFELFTCNVENLFVSYLIFKFFCTLFVNPRLDLFFWCVHQIFQFWKVMCLILHESFAWKCSTGMTLNQVKSHKLNALPWRWWKYIFWFEHKRKFENQKNVIKNRRVSLWGGQANQIIPTQPPLPAHTTRVRGEN